MTAIFSDCFLSGELDFRYHDCCSGGSSFGTDSGNALFWGVSVETIAVSVVSDAPTMGAFAPSLGRGFLARLNKAANRAPPLVVSVVSALSEATPDAGVAGAREEGLSTGDESETTSVVCIARWRGFPVGSCSVLRDLCDLDVKFGIGVASYYQYRVFGIIFATDTGMEHTTPALAMPSMPATELRIVFEHTNGPLKGLYEIMGTIGQLRENPEDPLPDHAQGFEAHGRLIDFASLIKVTRSYALYREIPRDSQGNYYPVRVK